MIGKEVYMSDDSDDDDDFDGDHEHDGHDDHHGGPAGHHDHDHHDHGQEAPHHGHPAHTDNGHSDGHDHHGHHDPHGGDHHGAHGHGHVRTVMGPDGQMVELDHNNYPVRRPPPQLSKPDVDLAPGLGVCLGVVIGAAFGIAAMMVASLLLGIASGSILKFPVVSWPFMAALAIGAYIGYGKGKDAQAMSRQAPKRKA